MERTLVLCKPDCVQRRLLGRVIGRLEEKGLRIVGMKLVWLSREQAGEFYAEHRGQDFFGPLVEFISSAPVAAMVVEGPEAIGVVRRLIGPTIPSEAAPGTIRGDLGLFRRLNLVHGSDSAAAARREVELLFDGRELFDYSQADVERLIQAAHAEER